MMKLIVSNIVLFGAFFGFVQSANAVALLLPAVQAAREAGRRTEVHGFDIDVNPAWLATASNPASSDSGKSSSEFILEIGEPFPGGFVSFEALDAIYIDGELGEMLLLAGIYRVHTFEHGDLVVAPFIGILQLNPGDAGELQFLAQFPAQNNFTLVATWRVPTPPVPTRR